MLIIMFYEQPGIHYMQFLKAHIFTPISNKQHTCFKFKAKSDTCLLSMRDFNLFDS